MFVNVPVRRGFDTVRSLFALIEGKGFICGGYARWCASPVIDPVAAGDVDVYCYSDESFEDLNVLLREHLEVAIDTPRAITFKRTTSGRLAYVPEVQLVKPVSKFKIVTKGSKEDVLSNFDFTIVRACITSPSEALVDEDFELDELRQVLRLRNIHCPISSTLRCVKYAKRGYRLRPFDILPLFLDWDSRDEAYRKEIIEGLGDLQRAMDAEEKLDSDRLTAIYELLNVD